MATPKQIAANRRNAQKSTGPRTSKGKTSVSQNAVKDPLLMRRTLVPRESRDEYDALARSLERDLKPHDALERALVCQIANAEWRLNRAVDLETGLFTERFDDIRRRRGLPVSQPLDASSTRSFSAVCCFQKNRGQSTALKRRR